MFFERFPKFLLSKSSDISAGPCVLDPLHRRIAAATAQSFTPKTAMAAETAQKRSDAEACEDLWKDGAPLTHTLTHVEAYINIYRYILF